MKKQPLTNYLFCLLDLVLAIAAIILALKGAWPAAAAFCLLIAASCLLQRGLNTRCPACKRLGALHLLEKTPIENEEVTVTETITERVDAVRTNFNHAERVSTVQTVYEVTSKCRYCGEIHSCTVVSTKKQF